MSGVLPSKSKAHVSKTKSHSKIPFADITNVSTNAAKNKSKGVKKLEQKEKIIKYLKVKRNINVEDTEKKGSEITDNQVSCLSRSSSSNSLLNTSFSKEFEKSISINENFENDPKHFISEMELSNIYECVVCDDFSIPKFNINSPIYNFIISKSTLDKRLNLRPRWPYFSAMGEYEISPDNKYHSKCLVLNHPRILNQYEVRDELISMIDGDEKSHKILGALLLEHYHEMELEKLKRYRCQDFLNNQKQITGSIIGSFANYIFKLTNTYFKSCSIHVVSYTILLIYRYLQNAPNVSLQEMSSVLKAAINLSVLEYIPDVTPLTVSQILDCSQHQLDTWNMHLLVTIGFNRSNDVLVTNFLDKYFRVMILSSETNNRLHLDLVRLISRFILEMTSHCYNMHLITPSKRAAAILWLSRLIANQYIHLQEKDFQELIQSPEISNTINENIWPRSLELFTSYSHQDIFELAIQFHYLVLSMLNYQPKIRVITQATFEKFESETYKSLSSVYENLSMPFFSGIHLYCKCNNWPLTSVLSNHQLNLLIQLYHNYEDNYIVSGLQYNLTDEPIKWDNPLQSTTYNSYYKRQYKDNNSSSDGYSSNSSFYTRKQSTNSLSL